MKKYQVGNSSDLAEIIIDYSKKKVKLINPETNKEFEKKINSKYKLDFSFTFKFGVLFLFLFSFLFVFFIIGDIVIARFTLLYSESMFALYLLFIIFPILSEKLHHFGQFMTHNFFKVKNVVIVKNIDKEIYVLPYAFNNLLLNYKLTGDFSKYILKVHIKPKDFFWRRRKKMIRQTYEWDALFYFSKIPKKGKMEVEWI